MHDYIISLLQKNIVQKHSIPPDWRIYNREMTFSNTALHMFKKHQIKRRGQNHYLSGKTEGNFFFKLKNYLKWPYIK